MHSRERGALCGGRDIKTPFVVPRFLFLAGDILLVGEVCMA